MIPRWLRDRLPHGRALSAARQRPPFQFWSAPALPRVFAIVIAFLVLLPILSVASNLLLAPSPTIAHLWETILPEVLLNTAALAVIVGAGCILIGTTTAWLVAMFDFPGARILQWLLILPLAMPSYIVGYAYSDFLAFAGPVQTMLRDTFGWSKGDYWFPNAEGVTGAGAMFVLVLYPYVYILSRTAFLEQSTTMLEAARVLGHGAWARFTAVALPSARPAIASGVALALMETLADFGTVQYFGVHTFTTVIYRTWLGMSDPIGAGQLSSALLIFIVTVVLLERWMRRRQRHHRPGRREHVVKPARLQGAAAALAFLLCSLPVVFGFLLPVAILLRLHLLGGDAMSASSFLRLTANSLAMAATAALLITVTGLLLVSALRSFGTGRDRAIIGLCGIGYILPGTVIAVGFLAPLGAFDAALNAISQAAFDWSIGLFLSGTIGALLLAYLVRFLNLAISSLDAGYSKLPVSIDHAARSLGTSAAGLLWRIHLPLLRRAIITGFLLVFADVLKELPATLILRPFNFDTLAVRAYQLASDERLAQAATDALVIVAIGLLPIVALVRAIQTEAPALLHRNEPE